MDKKEMLSRRTWQYLTWTSNTAATMWLGGSDWNLYAQVLLPLWEIKCNLLHVHIIAVKCFSWQENTGFNDVIKNKKNKTKHTHTHTDVLGWWSNICDSKQSLNDQKMLLLKILCLDQWIISLEKKWFFFSIILWQRKRGGKAEIEAAFKRLSVRELTLERLYKQVTFFKTYQFTSILMSWDVLVSFWKPVKLRMLDFCIDTVLFCHTIFPCHGTWAQKGGNCENE